MIKEAALKDTLLALASEHRSNFAIIVAITNELAALRETVRGLDPTFADVMEDRRNQAEVKEEKKLQRFLSVTIS